MAKMDFNPLGQWHGRVGGIVYRVQNGKQIAMPVISREGKTPTRTPLQMMVRAKFTLAAKLAKITPIEVLRGLNASGNLNKLNRYRSIIYKNSVATGDNGVYTAELDATKLIFSEGKSVGFDGSLTNGGCVTFNFLNVGELQKMMVVAVYADKEKQYVEVRYQLIELDETFEGSLTTGLPTWSGDKGTTQVYIVPLTLTEAGSSLANSGEYAKLPTETDNEYMYRLFTASESAFEFGQSIYMGVAQGFAA